MFPLVGALQPPAFYPIVGSLWELCEYFAIGQQKSCWPQLLPRPFLQVSCSNGPTLVSCRRTSQMLTLLFRLSHLVSPSRVIIILGTSLTRHLAHFSFRSARHALSACANWSAFSSSCSNLVPGEGIKARPKLICATFPMITFGGGTRLVSVSLR